MSSGGGSGGGGRNYLKWKSYKIFNYGKLKFVLGKRLKRKTTDFKGAMRMPFSLLMTLQVSFKHLC